MSETKENVQEYLPVMGVGPVCIAIMITFTAAGIALVKFGVLAGGNVNGTRTAILFVIAGILCIAGGIANGSTALFRGKEDEYE